MVRAAQQPARPGSATKETDLHKLAIATVFSVVALLPTIGLAEAPPADRHPGPPNGCLGEEIRAEAESFNLGEAVSKYAHDWPQGFNGAVQTYLASPCGIGQAQAPN